MARPKRTDKDNDLASSAEKHTKPGEMRKTYVLKSDHVEDVRRIAYWDRKELKEVVSEALEAYFRAYIKKHGEIKPIPKK